MVEDLTASDRHASNIYSSLLQFLLLLGLTGTDEDYLPFFLKCINLQKCAEVFWERRLL